MIFSKTENVAKIFALTTSIQHCAEVLASDIKEKWNRRNKDSGRLFLFINNMTEKPEPVKNKERKKQLELIDEFSNVLGCIQVKKNQLNSPY